MFCKCTGMYTADVERRRVVEIVDRHISIYKEKQGTNNEVDFALEALEYLKNDLGGVHGVRTGL